MYLAKLIIRNFRSISFCEINFTPGLNIIVGENNIGKSTVIDALRALLPSVDQKSFTTTDLDIYTENPEASIEFDYVFDGLTNDEEAIFIEALKPHENRFQALFHVRLKPGKYGRSLISQRWCGEHEKESIPIDIFEELLCVYLPPLRNPTEGLKPGYVSQIARLVKSFSSEEDEQNLIEIVEQVDEKLKKQKPIADACKAMNDKIRGITGTDLNQQVNMSFSSTNFKKILGRLALFIENMDVEQNGLGYNNIVYTAAVLSQLTHEHKSAYRALLIEEPEAHLHPQLQTLLLRHLSEQAEAKTGFIKGSSSTMNTSVQVIVTSHSPTFASQAPLESIVSLHRNNHQINSVNISRLEIDEKGKKKLERFLDSTKAELFFAKKLIMVEGIAEALLLPIFAKKIGTDIKDKAISIINVQGLNFKPFLNILLENGIQVPCSIITDSDPNPKKTSFPKQDEIVTPSSTARSLKNVETDKVRVHLSQKTFEYDLALHSNNLPTLIKAFKACHPKTGQQLESELTEITDEHQKAVKFFQKFESSCKSKGEFAQELAYLIEQGSDFTIPDYIITAISHVISDERVNKNG